MLLHDVYYYGVDNFKIIVYVTTYIYAIKHL